MLGHSEFIKKTFVVGAPKVLLAKKHYLSKTLKKSKGDPSTGSANVKCIK